MKKSITYNEFDMLDLRVGEILEAEAPEWSKKLLKLTVNLGEEIGKRTIFAGVKEWYDPEFFVGKKGVFVVNLEPKKMNGEESQGMMLMSDAEEKPTPIFVEAAVSNGTVVR